MTTTTTRTATTTKQLVVNWGGTEPCPAPHVLNKPESVRDAINKLTAFQKLAAAGVRIPAFSTTKPVVSDGIWLGRTALCGSGGTGIVVIRKGTPIPDAPLYVKYIPKLIEYRVHVFRNSVLFAQQKRRRRDEEQNRDQKLIRNHDNGWVFCPIPVEELTEDTKNVAIAAVAGLDLDFGAVDLVIDKRDSCAYALEVNTAPGLESPGLIEAYTTAFYNAYKELNDDTASTGTAKPLQGDVEIPESSSGNS